MTYTSFLRGCSLPCPVYVAVFYDLPPTDGEILLILRLVFGSAMVVSIILGFLAVRRRDFVRHSAWMARAYAIGIAAGTQALVSIPWIILVGPPGELARALLLGAAWVLNLAVAKYFIYRRSQGSTRAPRPTRRPVGPQPEPSH